MRFVMAMLIVSACGQPGGADEAADEASEPTVLTETSFNEAYADKYCAELEVCGSDFRCTTGSTSTTSTYVDDCVFDPIAAQDCMDGTWECDDALLLPVPPPACSVVYSC